MLNYSGLLVPLKCVWQTYLSRLQLLCYSTFVDGCISDQFIPYLSSCVLRCLFCLVLSLYVKQYIISLRCHFCMCNSVTKSVVCNINMVSCFEYRRNSTTVHYFLFSIFLVQNISKPCNFHARSNVRRKLSTY